MTNILAKAFIMSVLEKNQFILSVDTEWIMLWKQGCPIVEFRKNSFSENLEDNWLATLLEHWMDTGNKLADLVIVGESRPSHACL